MAGVLSELTEEEFWVVLLSWLPENGFFVVWSSRSDVLEDGAEEGFE